VKLALVIRGHVRDGLFSTGLKQHIDYMQQRGHKVDLFLHSWSESEARCSYRKLDRSHLFTITPEYLNAYFKGCTVKKILVQDDSALKLHGNLTGTVSSTKCPVIAWKRMWAGKYEIIKYVYDTYCGDYDRVISTRYDMFTNSVCYTPVKNLLALSDDVSKLSLKYPKYYRLLKGVDNYYAGTVETLHSISYDFHYSLDNILQGKSVKAFHEEIFYKHAVDSNYV
jgi:hypothetical protein